MSSKGDPGGNSNGKGFTFLTTVVDVEMFTTAGINFSVKSANEAGLSCEIAGWLKNIKIIIVENSENFENKDLINNVLLIIEKFLKIHIKNQIENGANVIQIFDSWAGLLEERDYPNYIYTPTLNLVNYVKSLGVPVICFPREIKNYKEFCEIVKPDVINIDYNVDPLMVSKNIKIPVQGGLDPKILLTDQENLKKEVLRYLDLFKDHPYIFNLGHGILPETDPAMVEYLINIVKDY